MEKFHTENKGKPENKGKAEDKIEREDEAKTKEEAKLDLEGKLVHDGKLDGERQPIVEGQVEDEGKLQIQGKSKNETSGEGTSKSQVQPSCVWQPTGKHHAEDYVPRKAKRKMDRGTEDFSKKNLQDRYLSSEEIMTQCTIDVSRAQEELRAKQKMQRELLDVYPQGAQGASGQ
ncbi:transcription elongation factor A protein-like 3 [Cavia porcellus]|uniref:transcription elongation factor A protein-like 3 n=1 Tax=Cavia porcellus TaxID=10141 RepID=UPI000661A667|nr:transcription elongation factor A protein-like 3 [Cavia porcellus]